MCVAWRSIFNTLAIKFYYKLFLEYITDLKGDQTYKERNLLLETHATC